MYLHIRIVQKMKDKIIPKHKSNTLKDVSENHKKLLYIAASNKTVPDLKIRTYFYIKCFWSYL